MTSTSDNSDKATSVDAVIAARRAERAAKEKRRADAQEKAEARHPAYRRRSQ